MKHMALNSGPNFLEQKMGFKKGIFCAAVLFLTMLAGAAACDAASETCDFDRKTPLRFHTRGGYILDQYDRVIMLRGVNVPACYQYPFHFTEADLDALRGFGFNFIRMPLSWKYFEEQKGRYNQEHLDDILNFIHAAQERGIYTMPDVHQVAWCTGGGQIPDWMCTVKAKHLMDEPVIREQTDRFWHSKELQAELIRFWLYLIEHFKDEPGVAIYNILNEPFSYDGLTAGKFEKCCLWPFYEDAIAAMRAADPDRPIALDPHPMSTVLPAWTAPLPFDNIIYAPHTYFPHGYGPGGLKVFSEESPVDVRMKYKRYNQDAEKMNAPWLVGEYGAVDPDKYPFVIPWFQENITMQERYFIGSTAWDYNVGGSGWNINTKYKELQPYLKDILYRPYPRATAGTPEALYYDVDTKSFHYRFNQNPDNCAPTEIFYPPELYEASEVTFHSESCIDFLYGYNNDTGVLTIPAGCPGTFEITGTLKKPANPD